MQLTHTTLNSFAVGKCWLFPDTPSVRPQRSTTSQSDTQCALISAQVGVLHGDPPYPGKTNEKARGDRATGPKCPNVLS